jgi:hypothetical protein
MTRQRKLFSLACLSGVLLFSCSPTPQRSTDGARITSQYDEGGKLARLEYDRNGDGKPETWGYMDGARVVRVEVDENGDGRVDIWEYHRDVPSSNGNAGQVDVGASVERIERATRHDGKVSRKEYFEKGALARVEEDTDGNGAIDKWETYKDGGLEILALDTSGRGSPDRRLIYRPDGVLDHLESDPTGSGAFQAIAP